MMPVSFVLAGFLAAQTGQLRECVAETDTLIEADDAILGRRAHRSVDQEWLLSAEEAAPAEATAEATAEV